MKQSLKEQFNERVFEVDSPKVLVVAVKLPSGAIEVITNAHELESKTLYYMQNYDSEFRLKANPAVQIVDFILV